jgi:prophage antirepressor-like protein
MTDLINSIDINLSFNKETIRILGTNESPLFVVKDICKILGLTNVTEVLRNIPDKWKYSVKLNTSNKGFQTSNVINEAGLYKIIMRSNKEIAQSFQEFVCEEILPSIRKDGQYKYQKILEEKISSDKLLKEREEEKNKADKLLEESQEEVNKLKKKYIKQKKEVFDDKNVVYLMTSEEGEKCREYTIGKTTNLSKRKENYNNNKLHDFKVIYYVVCKNSKFMDITESNVLMKLEAYRCKAGRDVFELPESKDISLFTNIFDECIQFYIDVENAIFPKRTIEEDKDTHKERNIKYQQENKDEIKKTAKEYYEDNKEPLKIIKKEYYENNTEVIAEKHKKYYEENKKNVIENVKEYYEENKEDILEKRKEFYKDNKDKILEERAAYYKDNYKTKISEQRQKKETCECGMIISHYSLKRHKVSNRHKQLMLTKQIETTN